MSSLNYDVNREQIIAATAPQDFTAAWADLGSEIQMHGFNSLGVWLSIDINGSSDLRIRGLAKLGKDDANEYVFPIQLVAETVVSLNAEYFELGSDADQKIFFEIDTKGHVGFVQLQIIAGTLGAGVAAQVDECIITKRYDA